MAFCIGFNGGIYSMEESRGLMKIKITPLRKTIRDSIYYSARNSAWYSISNSVSNSVFDSAYYSICRSVTFCDSVSSSIRRSIDKA